LLTFVKELTKKLVKLTWRDLKMSEELNDKIDQEVDELVEKLSEEDQQLLDQALANLMGFIEEETTIGYWVEEDQETSDKKRQPSSE
jgi:cytidylate kinase|tara:strand:- start:717 stop:977 length:261 start_codon:yes stop_codon:yes gene_type:complete